MLEASRVNGVERFFFSSSACVYPQAKQEMADVTALKEEDAYPYDPDEGYGWEKLFTEKLCQYYTEDYNLETRVARFHNVYGPLGTYDGGREKAPAAIMRKVALAQDMGGVMEYCHGVGIKLNHLLARELGVGHEVAKTLKQALDPANIMNPGKLGM